MLAEDGRRTRFAEQRGCENGDPPDQDEPDFLTVERPAEPYEVFEIRRA